MLNTVNGEPSLLVDVDDNYDPKDFTFWVINGAWRGKFVNGNMSVNDKYDSVCTFCRGMTISCDNQDRLRGDYQEVFNNFDNVDYVAPKPEYKKTGSDDYDDDIAF